LPAWKDIRIMPIEVKYTVTAYGSYEISEEELKEWNVTIDTIDPWGLEDMALDDFRNGGAEVEVDIESVKQIDN
jgi:hypothetical protein